LFRQLIAAFAALVLFVATPAGGWAQLEDRGPIAVPDEAQSLIIEMQQLQNRLRPIQQQAMQDPGLRAAGDSVGLEIRAAMVQVEPATPMLIEELTELMQEAEQAQAVNDQVRFNRVIREAAELDQLLQLAQAKAVERPDVLARVEAFEARVHQKMITNNPEAGEIIRRLDELNVRLAALLGH
jgi:hypothetical protein